MLGRSQSVPIDEGYWVGQRKEHDFPELTLYELLLELRRGHEDQEYITVNIRLMGFVNTPVYTVVVGTPIQERPLANLARHRESIAINFKAPAGETAVHPWTNDQL